MPELNREWLNWLDHNTARRCTPESMVEAMVKAGFAVERAWAAVERAAAAALEGRVPASPPQRATESAPVVADGNRIVAGGREIAVVMRCARPRLAVYDNVLSSAECDAMIARALPRLRNSTTVNPETGAEEVIALRNSSGIWMQRGEDAEIARIEARLAELMQCPVENGEGLQILRYGIGGEYRPHFDYFSPDLAGSAVHTARGGQRIATLIVYLNDVAAGGATIFPELDIAVAPRRGSAVYFSSVDAAGAVDPRTLHGGSPVLAGEKWIMTKWVRERAYV
jgi:prolyl 4-hydroxylase